MSGARRRVIPPGSTLGILGGGQLGRMAAMAARSLGYRVHTLDPDPECAARYLVDRFYAAPFDDAGAAAAMAAGCDVVTLEIEKIAPASMAAAAACCPVRPGPEVLAMVQDRRLQKEWLATQGFPLGPFAAAGDPGGAEEAARTLGGRCFMKASRGGYDGRGQVKTEQAADARAAFMVLGGGPVVVEAALPLAAELSVLVARSPCGEIAVYPPARNHHVERVLEWSVLPGPFPPEIIAEGQALGRAIADALRLEGLLAVELFLLPDGTLRVNELSPRPHNTFHGTMLACLCDQFEQLVRAVCDLPLGGVDLLRPTAILNLLGDLWLGERPPDFAAALALPGVQLHLYGKGPPRPGRKMGHILAIGDGPEEALARAREARARLAVP